MAKIGDVERLPCGCELRLVVTDEGQNQFHIKPCALDCKYYLFTLEETRKQGKPVELRDSDQI